jgi:tetratricopeptide (TPR) repeat protein
MGPTSRLPSSWPKPRKEVRDPRRGPGTRILFIAVLCVIAGCSDSRYALLSKGNAQIDAGADSSALASFTSALRMDSTFAAAYFNRGVIYLRWGQLDRAISEFDAASRYDRTSTEAYRARAAALKTSLNRLSTPDSCPINLSVQKTRRFATAVLMYHDLTKLIDADPYDVVALADRVECASEMGDRESMRQDLDRALRLEPGDVWLLNRRGRLQADLGNYGVAVADYTRALASCDTCPYLLYNRALALMEQGELRRALDDLNAVVKSDPEDGPAWYASGRCLVMLGRIPEGENCLVKASLLGESDATLLLGRLRP